jgi:D-alanyl-D-alanine carboxypeptidase
MAYHNETKNSHVHVVLNIHQDTGERINIRKKDLRDLREGFAAALVEYGYNVQATRKYGYKRKEFEELALRENRNTYEVVDFGTASYQLEQGKDKSCYLIYKTSKDKEVTIWGKELLDEVRRNSIKKGDLVKIKKTGQVAVKVPVYGDDRATILSWKVAKCNRWEIEKAGSGFTFSKAYDDFEEIQLNSPERFAKQFKQKEKFEHEKQIFLGLSSEEKMSPELELRHKLPEQKFRF